MHWRRSAAAALPLALFGCGPGVPERSADLEQLFGAQQADGADRFVLIGGLARDAAGRIWVADELGSEVMVFAPDGSFSFRVGSPGVGPGEFSTVCCIAFDAQDRLWTYDLGNRRFQVFRPEESGATLLFEVPAPHEGETLGLTITFDESGRVNDVREVGEGYDGGAIRYVLDSLGTAVDTLLLEPVALDSLELYPVRTAAGPGLVSPPFGPRDLIAFGPGGDHARANSRRALVTWYGPGGEVIASFGNVQDTGPVLSPDQRLEAERILSEDARRLGISILELGPLLTFRNQVLAGLFFDRAGRLWVERTVQPDDDRIAEVYTRDGTLAFTATWPPEVDLAEYTWIDDDVAIGIRPDTERSTEQVARIRWR